MNAIAGPFLCGPNSLGSHFLLPGGDDSSLSELSSSDSSDCEDSESSSDCSSLLSLFLGIGKQFLKCFTDESPGDEEGAFANFRIL